MSLYADYLHEKTDDEIYESDVGFASYRFLNDFKTVYIVDIYIVPKFRNSGAASVMADHIVELAKAKGAIELLGTVMCTNKKSTQSLQVLIGYGMTLKSAANDVIIFRKDI